MRLYLRGSLYLMVIKDPVSWLFDGPSIPFTYPHSREPINTYYIISFFLPISLISSLPGLCCQWSEPPSLHCVSFIGQINLIIINITWAFDSNKATECMKCKFVTAELLVLYNISFIKCFLCTCPIRRRETGEPHRSLLLNDDRHHN